MIKSQVRHQVKNQVRDQVWLRVLDQVWTKLDYQVWDPTIEWQVQDQLRLDLGELYD